MKKYVITCAPDVALNVLINVERQATMNTIAGRCVWCGKAADERHYPALLQDIAVEDSHIFYRACCQEHADEYRANYTALIETTLAPTP